MAHAYQGHKIVTLNMNGITNEKGTSAKRKELLQTTLQDIDASLIFCQEFHGKFGEVVDEDEYDGIKNGKEAGVAWLMKDFQRCDDSPSTSDTKITKIRDRLAEDSTLVVTDLLSRVAIVKLRTTEERESDRTTFLAVSWHGPHKIEEKIKVFLGLIRFCKDVCKMLGGIPFIIGGDFNFNTSKVDKDVDLNEEEINQPPEYPLSQRALRLIDQPEYPLSQRAKTQGKHRNYIPYKDNFVFSGDTISLTEVKSFDFESESDISQLQMQEILGKTALVNVLDHDPILAMLKFSRPAPEEDEGVRSVTKGIEEKLDISWSGYLRRLTGGLF